MSLARAHAPFSEDVTSPPTLTVATTLELEFKRRWIANDYSPGAAQPPYPPAPSLPDELLILIFTCDDLSTSELASAARVCRLWHFAATQFLYSSLSLDFGLGGGSTLISDYETLLGWTSLLPAVPGLQTFTLWAHENSSATTILARASALRAVRELHVDGPTTALLVDIPHRLEKLSLYAPSETLPPLPDLRSLSISNSPPTFEHELHNLRTLKLLRMDRNLLRKTLDSLAPRAANLHTLTLLYMDTDYNTYPIADLPSSVMVLRVELMLAFRHSTGALAAVEEFEVVLDHHRWYDGLYDTDLQRLRSLVLGCGRLKVVRIVGMSWRGPKVRHAGPDFGSGVRVEYVRLDPW
ncbi:hypothetical protein EXIGLDRAFT_832544 [Exidia glandulosa HHB12029]|uniref:F-box domain-containing protein n=1 Tax=Exidia glandulosa HHB12029 TaxID=1314781 RepID=A0A166B518_EXIGL|nr:hypothetical protein EXIGLDRAFT_832544 [Exidia glandulosa HHB12029]